MDLSRSIWSCFESPCRCKKLKTEISRNMPLSRNAGRGVHHRHKKHITAVKRCLVSLLQYGTPIGSFKQQSFFFSVVAVWQRQRNLRREHVVRRWRLASLPCWVPANSLVGCLQNLGVPRPTEAFQGNGQPLLIASLCTDKLQHTQTPIKQWTNLMSKNLI